MANSKCEIVKLVFVIEPDATKCEVTTRSDWDPAQGVFNQSFPPGTSVQDILIGPVAEMEFLTQWGRGTI